MEIGFLDRSCLELFETRLSMSLLLVAGLDGKRVLHIIYGDCAELVQERKN